METGRQLGRYQLLRLLGFGGMGEVYLASARGAAGFEKLVTVKILRKQLSGDPERVSDLLREAFIGVRLDHENIVQVFDLGEHEGTYFLVMEYVRGFSLRDVIAFAAEQGEALPLRPIAHIVRSIADALDYLHRVRGPHRKPLDLVHRDVSPSNILLGAEGRIKLSDFGVAGMAQDSARAGAVIGKPRYLPPEARDGAPATQGWDLYALGVVLHAALASDPDPDVEPSASNTVRGPREPRTVGLSAIGERLPPLRPIRPDLPPAVVDLVDRATSRDPAKRIVDAAEMRRLVDAAVPRQADDVDFWRHWLQVLYKRDELIARFGVLPHVEDLVPELRSAPPETSAAYIETVIVDAARPIKLGISPALGVDAARAQSERVAAWLKTRVERDVRPVVYGDYRALVDAISEGEVDLAWLPPVSLVHAAERGAGVLALAQRFGRPSYESAIIVRADSRLRTLSDLRDTTISFVDRDSASGYVFAADLVKRLLGPLANVFREQHFQGSHKAVCEAVVRGWVDAGTTYVVRAPDGRVAHSGWLDLTSARDDIRVLAYSDPVPCDAIAHRPGLAPALVERLAGTIVDVAEDDTEGRAVLKEIFHTTGMIRADLRIYGSVRDALSRLA